MADTTTAFTGDVPENYDRFMGSMFFEPYARDVALRVTATNPREVLELACGTGIVTAALREALPVTTTITATDLNPAMIACARSKRTMPSELRWRQADAQQLPFEDESFDVVVCQFGFMFLPDKARGLREACRVLRRGGRLLFSTWDSLQENPLCAEAHGYLISRFPDNPPQFMLTPFGWFDVDAITELVRGAGFSLVRSETLQLRARTPAADQAARGMLVGSPAAAQIVERGVQPEELVQGFASRLRNRHGEGAIDVPMQAIVFDAVRT
ncbi:MAG: class I SAM-dependent methyltransferase [Deltaproteobacteria bacterium]|nr:class I SAM-dependent methyltransferase [Deltaproteobacteria bacterium]